MPFKRPLCDEDNNRIRSKRAKMIKECMTKKTVVKLIDVVEEINKKKTLFKLIKNHDLTNLLELLTLKVNVHIRDSEGSTPLHLAVELGYLDIVKLLVQNGAHLIATNLTESPLQIAIGRRFYAIAKYLLENGAEVSPDDNSGFYSPLVRAIKDCQVDVVKLLLSHGPFLVNVLYNLDCENETPLEMAIKNQNFEIIQMLLENGANPNFYDNSEDTVPAMDQALEIGNSVIIKMLLKYGADGNTFLSQAIISKNNLAMVELLLKNNVNVNICDYYGMPHLHFAITRTINIEIIYLLIRFGADINAPDADSHNPLHYAIQFRKEDFQLLELLMKNGANPNLKDKQDTSTIEYALYKKNTKYFKAIFYNQCYL